MIKQLLSTVSMTAIVMAMGVSPAFAADDAAVEKLSKMIETQQQELKQMRAELSNLKKKQAEPAASTTTSAAKPAKGKAATVAADAKAGKYVEVGEFPGSMKFPGTDVSVKIGGQIKVDSLYTFGSSAGLSEDLFQTRTISATATPKSNRFRMHARETRLNVDVRAPSEWGALRAFTEFDLFGGSSAAFPQEQVNGYEIRLRHAYVQVGQLMVGQNWSTFNDPAAFAETLDFAQVNGESFIRQPQARWTQPVGEGVSVAFAVENPEGDISDNTAPGTGRRTNADNVPDVIGNVRYEQAWGHLQAGALYRRLKVTGDTTDPTFNDSDAGYGVNVSGKIAVPVINEKDNFKFQVNYGEGIGRYINDLQLTGTETFDAAINRTNREIDPLEAVGAYGSYQLVFSDKWRSNLTGGYVHISQPDYQPATAMQSTIYTAANVIWSPVKKFDLGLELLWGQRENRNGQESSATRVQASAKYAF